MGSWEIVEKLVIWFDLVISLAGSPQAPADYVANPNPGTLQFSAGDGPFDSQPFNVPINNDVLVENTETIDLQASIVGGVGTFSAGGDTATINIADDDSKLYMQVFSLA